MRFATPLFTREKTYSLSGLKDLKNFMKNALPALWASPKHFQSRQLRLKTKWIIRLFRFFAKKNSPFRNSIAFRFEYRGKSLVITGDADYDQDIIELSNNTDLLIADCSFTESMKGRGI